MVIFIFGMILKKVEDEKKVPVTNVRCGFSPIRMIVGQKGPVKLIVEVINKDDYGKVYSVSVKLPPSLGFDKVGLMRELRRRIGCVNGKTRTDASFSLYPLRSLRAGFHDIDVFVRHHESDRYDKVMNEIHQKTQLRVE